MIARVTLRLGLPVWPLRPKICLFGWLLASEYFGKIFTFIFDIILIVAYVTLKNLFAHVICAALISLVWVVTRVRRFLVW